MPDNVTLPFTGDGDATPVVATDLIAGVHYQRVKTVWGVDGAQVDTSATNPLPVVQTGTPTAPAGVATSANQTTELTDLGGVTETAPGTDTASSGLNGRLQRIAQRLTSLIAVFTIGAGTEAAAVRVTLPTDGTGKVNVGTVTTLPALVAGTANIGDVDVLTVPADPFGATADATVAAGATGSISAKLRRATQGLEDLKTTIVLAAGSAAIGKLAANSGVDIGDVDVTTVGTITPGTTATSLGKAEDAAHASGDVGIMALGIRADTLASAAGATGDYVPASFDSIGAQYVVAEERLFTIKTSPTVSNGAAYAVADAVGGLLTFASAARFSGGGISVESVSIMCKTPALNASLELWLFDATVTVAADNAAVSYSDADAALCIGVIQLGPWVDSALNSISTRAGIGLAAVLAGTSLFGQLVTRTAVTLTSTTDIQVAITVRQG